MSIQTPVHGSEKRLSIIRTSETQNPKEGVEQHAFASAVREGLLARPKKLPFHYFYDEAGSTLFDEICNLPEYYLTRTEDGILKDHARAMVSGWLEPPTLIELGSGSAKKTERLISASLEEYGRLHYVAIDVSASAVESSAKQLVKLFPTLRVTGVVGNYHENFSAIAKRFRGPKLVAFLGSSLGNYEPANAAALLDKVSRALAPEDRFLLGVDLSKSQVQLEAAYDDSQGVTARFNKNLLARINRELQADFSLELFRHKAVFREALGRIEMHLVSLAKQTVNIPIAGVRIPFLEGESIHTENSHKYTSEMLRDLASRSGFVEENAWTDSRNWFRVQSWFKR